MAHAILTTVVGSYPIPHWLASQSASRLTRRDAIMVVLKTQELAGLDVITDGELSRFDPGHPETNGMIDHFIRPLAGVSTQLTRDELDEFRRDTGMSFRSRPAGVVRHKIGEGTLDLQADWEFVQSLTRTPLKFTVTSPYMLAKTLLDRHYRELDNLVMELAAVLRRQVEGLDAAVLQIDEANLPGHPEDNELCAEAINHIFASAQNEKAVHLCFGNYGGQSVQRGQWQNLLSFFNALECDHLVLEFARRGYDELAVFKDLKPGLALGLGVVDIKDNEVESPETIARRLEHAVGILGAERIRWIHPDCGFWMLPRSVADRKMRALVEGRDLFEGKNG